MRIPLKFPVIFFKLPVLLLKLSLLLLKLPLLLLKLPLLLLKLPLLFFKGDALELGKGTVFQAGNALKSKFSLKFFGRNCREGGEFAYK